LKRFESFLCTVFGLALLLAIAGGAYFLLNFIHKNFCKDTPTRRKRMCRSKLPAFKSATDPTKFLSQGKPAEEAAMGYTKTEDGRALVPVG
jgi:hypothetical protein